MISTGNDIVSFNEIDITRSKLPQFYSKILSATELPLYQQLENASIPFERFVWLFWAVKESAYKYLQRIDPALVFTPVKFTVDQFNLSLNFSTPDSAAGLEGFGGFGDPSINGSLVYLNNKLNFSALLTDRFVNSFVYLPDDLTANFWGIKKIEVMDAENQSAEVRKFVLEKLKELLGWSDLHIVKDEHDIPKLMNGETEIPFPVSLSHHGEFVAYSFISIPISKFNINF